MNKHSNIPVNLQPQANERLGKETAWLNDFRAKHLSELQRYGLPSKKNERWKYHDLTFLTEKKFAVAKPISDDALRNRINQHRLHQGNSILIVFVNGYWVPQFSELNKFIPSLIACNLSTALKNHAQLLQTHWSTAVNAQAYPFASLNAASFTDGLFLYIPDHYELSIPVHLLSLTSETEPFITHPRHLIILGKGSQLTFVQESAATFQQSYFSNSVMNVIVNEGARFNHIKIQNESLNATHIATTFIKQMQDSQVLNLNFASGSEFAREDVVVRLEKPGATCQTAGFYYLQKDQQCIDHHIEIDHLASQCNSEMLYKGVLEKKSRAIFNGKLHVSNKAAKTFAYQANHNLILAEDAEVYSKPELEIYAEDVQCKHGATIGQIDQAALFYLQSRGIGLELATNLLLQGFSEEVINKIIHPGIRQRIKKWCRYYAN